jgi:hypothetical protein
VIFVIGAQKLVPTLAAAHERIYQHSLPLEDARAQVAYGQHSQVAKILEIHQELPRRPAPVRHPARPGHGGVRPRPGQQRGGRQDPPGC